MGSGERITAAVALVDQNNIVKVINLLSPEILSVLYRSQGGNANSLIGIVADSFKSFLKSSRKIDDWNPPVSGFFALPLRDFVGQSAEDVMDQVAGLHSSLYKAKPPQAVGRTPSHSDHEIMDRVRDAARNKIGLRADDIFTPNGIIEVRDNGRVHHLNIPVKTADKVGSIISAWFSTPQTIEKHFLKAQSDLDVASERGKYSRGMFISFPSGVQGQKNRIGIENQIDDIYWRLQRVGCFLEVRETPEALADEIIGWAS